MVISCDVWEDNMELVNQIGKFACEMKKGGKFIGHSVWKAEGMQCPHFHLYENHRLDDVSAPYHCHTNGSLLIWMNMEGCSINVRKTIKELKIDFCKFIQDKIRHVKEIPIGYDTILLDSFLAIVEDIPFQILSKKKELLLDDQNGLK